MNKMIEEQVKYALKNFFKPEKFIYHSGLPSYEMREDSKQGKTKLTVNVGTTDSICFNTYDKFPKWEILLEQKNFGMRKCIDHFILKKNTSGIWELHMFEMKTSIGFETWQSVKYKMRSSYLSIKAFAVYLGILLQDSNITTYTTYENDKFTVNYMTSPTTIIPRIGGKATNSKTDEWDSGVMNIPMIVSENNPYDYKTVVKLKHKKIQMNRSDDGYLTQTFNLP